MFIIFAIVVHSVAAGGARLPIAS